MTEPHEKPADASEGSGPDRRARWLKPLFIALLVRPVLLVVLGINMRRRHLMPSRGPAIIVANHNSHLDTLTLMSLMPLSRIVKVRPVAAADYFMGSRWLRFLALDLIGILPISRGGKVANPVALCRDALDRGEVLILFPEGSRGEPEKLEAFKQGIALIAQARPEIPITPIFLHGLGKALPKGSWVLVPFFCDAFVGRSFTYGAIKAGADGNARAAFMAKVEASITALASEGDLPPWE